MPNFVLLCRRIVVYFFLRTIICDNSHKEIPSYIWRNRRIVSLAPSVPTKINKSYKKTSENYSKQPVHPVTRPPHSILRFSQKGLICFRVNELGIVNLYCWRFECFKVIHRVVSISHYSKSRIVGIFYGWRNVNQKSENKFCALLHLFAIYIKKNPSQFY